MTRITVNGTTINYELSGPEGAPTVTLSHSIATDLSMWKPQAEALSSAYRVLRFDTRGHGASDAPAGPYSLEVLADDAYGLLRALGIERTHFVGLSLGGMIGQTLALRHPEVVAGLVLADTSARMPPASGALWDERIETARRAGMEAHVEPTVGRWFTAPFRDAHPEVVEPVRHMIRSTEVEGYVGCAYAIKALDLLDRLPAISGPTLVIVGEADPATPVEAARAMVDRIPGARLVVIPDASHLSNLEQPEAFNRALVEFLEGLT